MNDKIQNQVDLIKSLYPPPDHRVLVSDFTSWKTVEVVARFEKAPGVFTWVTAAIYEEKNGELIEKFHLVNAMIENAVRFGMRLP